MEIIELEEMNRRELNREFIRVMKPFVSKMIKLMYTMDENQMSWMDGGSIKVTINSNNGMGIGFEEEINNGNI